MPTKSGKFALKGTGNIFARNTRGKREGLWGLRKRHPSAARTFISRESSGERYTVYRRTCSQVQNALLQQQKQQQQQRKKANAVRGITQLSSDARHMYYNNQSSVGVLFFFLIPAVCSTRSSRSLADGSIHKSTNVSCGYIGARARLEPG